MQAFTIADLLKSVEPEVVEWRRRLHRNPELSFEERKTANFVYETLESFEGLELSRPTPTSVLAKLAGTAEVTSGEGGAGVLALRADMDALPIQEDNDLDFASRNPGVMHACGHDGHTAMLLGAAKVLSCMREQIRGEVRFVFQHAEELFPGGAQELVKAGVMEGVDIVLGAHLWSALEVGKVGIGYGPMMASPDTFKITVYGKGGHAAKPHETVDSIAVGAQVVTNLQHIVSRATDPVEKLVVSVTQFNAGTADNVIPGSAELTGTVRSFDSALREKTPQIIERIVSGVTQAHGATSEIEYQRGYQPVVNDEAVTRQAEDTVREAFGEDHLEIMQPAMGGEDFSAYQQNTPGTFVYIGAARPGEEAYPHHHPRFDIDEGALAVGAEMFVRSVLQLQEGRESSFVS